MLYSALHHPDTLSSVESVEWEAATQIMIWEIVTGMRSSAAPYACMDTGLIDQFTGSVRYSDGKITPSVPSGPNTTFSAENWQSTA